MLATANAHSRLRPSLPTARLAWSTRAENNTKVAFPPIRVAEKCSARDAKMTAYCFECFHRGPRLRVQVGENSEMSDTS